MARRATVQRGLSWLDRIAGVMFAGFVISLAPTEIGLASREARLQFTVG